MKFSVNIADLLKSLAKTLPAIPPKSTLPVLEHIHATLEGNNLRLIGTDQDITIISHLNVIGFESGSILIPARRLNDIIKALGNKGEVEFMGNMENYDITLKSTNGKFTMKGLDPDEYLELPQLFDSEKPDVENQPTQIEVDIAKSVITRLAEKTYYAVSKDDYRPAMCGVLFQFRSNYVNAVATDSFRLVKITVASEENIYPEELDVILPAKTIDLMRKIDEDIKLSFVFDKDDNKKANHVRFDVGNTSIISKTVNERFPPYENVIPESNPRVVLIDKTELLTAIKRSALFVSAITKQIRMKFVGDTLTIEADDDDAGASASETLPCSYSGEEFLIGFNYKYIEEALSSVEPTQDAENVVCMTFGDPNRPALIKPSEDSKEMLTLVMPVRLS